MMTVTMIPTIVITITATAIVNVLADFGVIEGDIAVEIRKELTIYIKQQHTSEASNKDTLRTLKVFFSRHSYLSEMQYWQQRCSLFRIPCSGCIYLMQWILLIAREL